MTPVPETRKYPLSIWTRQPVRKFRMRPVTQDTVAEIQAAMSGKATEFHGATKAGQYIVIPADNIAFFEVGEMGGELE